MMLQVDKSGRVVLPKRIRDRFGLSAGTDLELVEMVDGVMLKVRGQHGAVMEEDGRWVYAGDLPPGFDVLSAIEQDREERDRKLMGSDGSR